MTTTAHDPQLLGTDTVGLTVADRPRANRQPRRSVLYDERTTVSVPSAGGSRSSSGTYQSGMFGETVVADALRDDGWRVLGHRVRTKVGELDLVVRRDDVVAFVEVKTAGPGRVDVEQSIDSRARHRIRRAAVAWIASHPLAQRGVRRYRFDVYVVRRDAHGVIVRVDQVCDAF